MEKKRQYAVCKNENSVLDGEFQQHLSSKKAINSFEFFLLPNRTKNEFFKKYQTFSVADNYGVSTYAIYLFLLTVWWSKVWENATACPYNPLEEVLEGSKAIYQALMLIVSQVLGGIVIFRYIEIIWSVEFAETHIGRIDEDCVADLAVFINIQI